MTRKPPVSLKKAGKDLRQRQLHPNGTMVGDKGFLELVSLPTLRFLSVDENTKVSKAVFLKAKKERPKLEMHY